MQFSALHGGPRASSARACAPSRHRADLVPVAAACRKADHSLRRCRRRTGPSARPAASPSSGGDAAPVHNHNNHGDHGGHNNKHGRNHNHNGGSNGQGAAPTTPTPTPTTTTPPPPPPPPPTRAELLAAVRRFVDTAFRAVREGPDAAASELSAQLHPAVALSADPVRRQQERVGLGALLQELGRLHAEYGPGATHRPILFGASAGAEEEVGAGEGDEEDAAGGQQQSRARRRAAVGAPVSAPPRSRAYALLEARYQDVNALPGHPATFRVSTVAWLVALELGPAPVAAAAGSSAAPPQQHHHHLITRVWLRRQLTYEDRDELLVDPVGVYPAPFPQQLLAAAHDGAEEAEEQEKQQQQRARRGAMARAVRSWWSAWAPPPRNGHGHNHNHNHNHGAEEHPASPSSSLPLDMLDADFGFYDAYGLWPTMRQATGSSSSSSSPAAASAPAPLHHAALRGPAAVGRYASALSSRYRVREWAVLDAAPADGGAAACFSHWRARLSPVPRHGGNGSSGAPSSSSSSSSEPPLVVEGFEIDLFDPASLSSSSNARLRGVYLFRGPLLGSERALFLDWAREQAAARERAVLSERRAAREAALADAAARLDEYQRWIASSLRRWGDKVYRAGAAGAAVLFSEEDGPPPPPGPLGGGGGGGGGGGAPPPSEEEAPERRRREEEAQRRWEEGHPLGPPGV